MRQATPSLPESPSAKRPIAALFAVLLTVAWPAAAQNAAIYNWPTDASGTVLAPRSPDVRIRPVGDDLTGFGADGFFDATVPETVSLIQSQNAVYVRFHANSGPLISDGLVTVTVSYAEAAPGLAPADLASATNGAAWKALGSYVMDVEPRADGLGEFLASGEVYPTVNEVTLPDRYRIVSPLEQPMPASFLLRVELSGDEEPADNLAYSYYDLTGGVPPADVVLLHDVSGSMEAQLPQAQDMAKMFVDLLNPGDRVGVVAFSDALPGNTQVAATLNRIGSIDPSDPAKVFAKGGIDSFVADGWTPMGSGVLMAQSVLNGVAAPAANRAIVLLTDGMENREPKILAPGHSILKGLNTDPHGPVALFPLWFGDLSQWGHGLLETAVTEVDKAKLVDQPGDILKLAEAYLMIRGTLTSDDIFDIHRGTTGDGFESSVDIDPVTGELILTVTVQRFGLNLGVEVRQPGEKSWKAAETVATSTAWGRLYAVYRFKDPAAGTWSYRLAPTAEGEPYVLAALADKVEVLMQSWLADYTVLAGKPLEIRARLTRQGAPVAARVFATVGMPKTSLGNVLYEYRDRLRSAPKASLATDAGKAAVVLGQLREWIGPELFLELAPKRVELADDDGDGVYTGRLETWTTGAYPVRVIAEGQADGRTFRRQHRHTCLVTFGMLDPDHSIVELSPDKLHLRTVTVTPVDKRGNFAPPGFADKIRIEASSGTWQTPQVVDLADGTYSRALEVRDGLSAEISVSVAGQDVSTTPRPTSPWRLHLSAGTVVPTGTWDSYLDRGSSLTLGLGYRWQPRRTALLMVGAFDFATEDSGSEEVLRVSGVLRQRLTKSRVYTYVQGGAGMYRFLDEWDGGWNLGLGLAYPASSRVELEGGVDYHKVLRGGDTDLAFWQTYLGFSFSF